MEIIMRKWYAFLSGKKMLGVGLTTVVALTALLAVNFYRGQNDRYVTTNGSADALTQADEMAQGNPSNGNPSNESSANANPEGEQVAEEMNHDLPIGSEVGEQQLAEQSGENPELAANDAPGQDANQDSSQNPVQEASDEVAEVAGQTSLVSMNLNFDASQKLQWPVAGRELIKSFSMDGLVYYPTLEEYKVCPAIMVQAQPGDAILAPADGIVSKISANEEIGTYLCLKLGDEYEALIGNLDNVSVAEGDYVLKGTVLGGLAEPTKYYLTEGPNLYFELLKDAQPIDPLDYLE